MGNFFKICLILTALFVRPSAEAKCPTAVEFPKFSSLTERQQSLILPYLSNLKKDFSTWSLENDGLATEFLANSQALSHLELLLAEGKTVFADHLILKVNRIEGDRIKVKLDAALFDNWVKAGSGYKIFRSSGDVESGKFTFNHGDLGGSRHSDYDIQGYTSYIRVPRIQMNYRYSDQEADIDLDGYAPWIFGFIPNPFHLTWNNSDPRCWMSKYEKKFGPVPVRLRK